MSLPRRCDLEIASGEFCDRPVTVFALSATTPALWGGGAAAMAGFCTLDHASQEPRPTLIQAEASFAEVIGAEAPAESQRVWSRLLAGFPHPVEAS